MNSFSMEIGYSVQTILVMQHIIHFVHVLLVCALRYIILSLLHGFSDVSHMVYLHIAYIFINIFLCSLKMRIDYIC